MELGSGGQARYVMIHVGFIWGRNNFNFMHLRSMNLCPNKSKPAQMKQNI